MTTDNTSNNTPDRLALRPSNVRSPGGGADVTGKHHKPPYNSPDPFRYRALTYVQLGLNLNRFSLAVICNSRLQLPEMSTIVPLRIGELHMTFALIHVR